MSAACPQDLLQYGLRWHFPVPEDIVWINAGLQRNDDGTAEICIKYRVQAGAAGEEAVATLVKTLHRTIAPGESNG